MKICSETLKEEFMAQLRNMAYEDGGLAMNCINYVMNQIGVERSKQSRVVEMAGTTL
jgi:hypothetical protein